MTDIIVKNVDVGLLKEQRDWVSKNIPEEDLGRKDVDERVAVGLVELLDTMILNATEKEKEYLVTRTASAVVSAFSPEDARSSFAYRVARNMVDEDTTVEEN